MLARLNWKTLSSGPWYRQPQYLGGSAAFPSFPYSILWGERIIRSVANLTRADGTEFLALAPQVPVRTEVRAYPLEQAGAALDDLRSGRVHGAAVIVP